MEDDQLQARLVRMATEGKDPANRALARRELERRYGVEALKQVQAGPYYDEFVPKSRHMPEVGPSTTSNVAATGKAVKQIRAREKSERQTELAKAGVPWEAQAQMFGEPEDLEKARQLQTAALAMIPGGMVAGNVARGAAPVVEAGMSRLLPNVPGWIAKLLGHTAVTAPVTAVAGNAVTAGANAAMNPIPGTNPLEEAGRAAVDAAQHTDIPYPTTNEADQWTIETTRLPTPAVGAAGQLLGELAGAAGRGVVNSRGGKARQFIESRGGKVGVADSGSGKPFETVIDDQGTKLGDLPPDDRGIGEASRSTAVHVLKDLDDKFFENYGNPHSQNRARIAESPAGQARRDTTDVYMELKDLSRSARLNPSEQKAIKTLLEGMETGQYGRVTAVKGPDGKPLITHKMTETELNDFRGMLQRMGNVGSAHPSSVPEDMIADVAGTVKGKVDEGPYAETNAFYNKGKSQLESSRNQLDLSSRPSHSLDPARPAPEAEGVSEPEVTKVANLLSRDKQTTVTAGVRNAKKVERFRQNHPQYSGELDKPELVRSKADLTFTAAGKKHGGLIDRMHPLAGAGVGLGMMPFVADDAKAIIGGIASQLVLQNLPAINGRLLFNPATKMITGGPAAGAAMSRAPQYMTGLDLAIGDGEKKRKQKATKKK